MRKRKARAYKQARFVQTLYEYDGPKLILFKTTGTSYVIAVAIINADYEQPFFGAEISEGQLQGLLSEDFGVRYLFLRPYFRSRYIIDLADLDTQATVNLLPKTLSPETVGYLPGRQFFASDFTEDVDFMPATTPKAEERIHVDGNWEIPEFNDLYGGYSDLYSFVDGLGRFEDTKSPMDTRRLVKQAFRNQWQGGGSYGSFYRTLRVVQPASDRLTLSGFEYHSPGWVDVEGQGDVLEVVTEMVKDFSANYEAIKKTYNVVYRYLQVNKLLSLKAADFDMTGAVAKNVERQGQSLSELLVGADWSSLVKLADDNVLVATKVVLSLYRRLNRLHDFELQGRVTF